MRNCKSCGKELKRQKIVCSTACRNKIYTNKGIKFTEEHKRKIAEAHIGMKAPWNVERNKKYRYKGEKAGNWKGLEVGYIALHQWMRKNFDWLEVCELCPITRGLHLSNKTQIYTRDKENWWILCASCHRRYDNSYRKNGGVIKIPHRWVKQNPQ